MALVLKPPQRRTGPSPAFGGALKIDSAHPLARGMTDCLVWNGGGIPPNLASPSVNTTVTGSPTPEMTVAGPAGYATGGSAYNIPDHGNIVAGDYALRILFTVVSWTGGFTALVDKGGASRELSFFFDTSGNLSFASVGTSGFSAATLNLTAGGTYDFLVTRIGSASNLYINGVLAANNGIANGTTASAGSALSFGGNPSGGGTTADIKYITAQIWNRGISADEAATLFSDPYGFLIPAEGQMPALFLPVTTTTGGARIRQRFNRSPLAYPAGAVPGFDPNHPAARNLWLSGVASGANYTNLVTGRPFTIGAGTASPAAIKGNIGPCVDSSNATPDRKLSVDLGLTLTPPAWTVGAIFVNTSSGLGGLVTTGANGGSGLYYSNANLSTFGLGVGGITLGMVAGHTYFVALSVNIGTGTPWNAIAVDLGTGQILTSSGVTSSTSTTDWRVMGFGPDGAGDQGSVIAAGMFSTSFLSMQQLLQWAADPWAFWYPNKTINLASAAASAGASFLPVWAYRYNLPVLGTGNF